MGINFGTGLILLGTVGLSMPSLLSTSHRHFRLSEPLLSHSFISKHLLFSYTVKSHSMPTVNSPEYTWITYMFHHSDINHFLGNMYAIISSTMYLNLGFWRTFLILYGGGIAGALSHILEMAVIHDTQWLFPNFDAFMKSTMQYFNQDYSSVESHIERFKKSLPTLPRTYLICGSSAGAFSLMGAEICMIGSELISLWRMIKSRRSNKQDLYSKFSLLVLGLVGRVATVTSQVYSMMDQSNVNNLSALNGRIGYSAHVGGFIFGFLVMNLLK